MLLVIPMLYVRMITRLSLVIGSFMNMKGIRRICVSARPDYYFAETGVDDRSDACCEIEKFGSTGYYFGGDNIEVYG